MVAWNTQMFIFGWCENILVGISSIVAFCSLGYNFDLLQQCDI
jgi:hypothetical protein